MMVLAAVEEIDKLMVSLLGLERFDLPPVLDLVASSLVIMSSTRSSGGRSGTC